MPLPRRMFRRSSPPHFIKQLRRVDLCIDWKSLEDYISANSLAKFSHSICPDCLTILYPEFADKLLKK